MRLSAFERLRQGVERSPRSGTELSGALVYRPLFSPNEWYGSVNNRRYGTYRHSERLVINLLTTREDAIP
jgi:hypothetical protein